MKTLVALSFLLTATVPAFADPYGNQLPASRGGGPGVYGGMIIGGSTSNRKRELARKEAFAKPVKAFKSKAECERVTGTSCNVK